MKLILFPLLLLIAFNSVTLAQNDPDPRTRQLLEQAARNGRTLNSEITVKSSIHVQAVLIPQVDAKRIFGKEVADRYAVIQLIVGNKSKAAALIVHGVFIDYRNWSLSGIPSPSVALSSNHDQYQAASISSQVASEEYRVVRGQLLDAQLDTPRNVFMRWLTLAGNLAGAFTFSLNEQGIVKGIAAVTGVGIPGVATAWPDRTVEQLNRVSDLGFRTNKLVPKESSEIIVCFFPIDRFLTPGFRQLFLKSPALFFAPLQMMVDKRVESDAKRLVGDMLGDFQLGFADLRRALPCYVKVNHPERTAVGYEVCLAEMGLETYRDPSTNREKMRPMVKKDAQGIAIKEKGMPVYETGFYKYMALEFISSASLNLVSVTVDGTMAVDVTSIPGSISEVEMDTVADCGDAGNECLWTNTTAAAGVRTGVMRGSYLNGAEVRLAEAETLNITDLKKIDEGSNDNELRFSLKLNAPLRNQTKLHFSAVKPPASADGRPLESNSWEYVVAYFPSATAVTLVTVDDVTAPKKLTVKGKGFKAAPLSVTLIPQAGDSVQVEPVASTVTETSFDVMLPTGDDKLHAGCWQVQVKAGELSSNQSEFFAIPPQPSLDAAERSDKFIFVKGKDLIDFSACGGQQMQFVLLKNDGSDPTDLEVKDWNNGAPVLELPDKAKTGEWKVRVGKGTTKSEKPLTVRP